jgi:hypothetical protein
MTRRNEGHAFHGAPGKRPGVGAGWRENLALARLSTFYPATAPPFSKFWAAPFLKKLVPSKNPGGLGSKISGLGFPAAAGSENP